MNSTGMQTCEALAEPDHGRTRRRVAAHARDEPRLPAPHGARPPALRFQRQRIRGEQGRGPREVRAIYRMLAANRGRRAA